MNLVAEGLSNLEIADLMFLSRRAVKAHVSHAPKLGVSTRAALAAEAARHEA